MEAAYVLESWGELRDDARSALGVSANLNIWRGKGTPVITVADCMLKFGAAAAEPPPRKTSAELWATLKGIAAAQNARVKAAKEKGARIEGAREKALERKRQKAAAKEKGRRK